MRFRPTQRTRAWQAAQLGLRGGAGVISQSSMPALAPAVTLRSLSEATTIAAAATTDTTIQIPANSIVASVSVTVLVVIPTAATFNYGVAGATARYGTGISVAATTTYPGTDDGNRFYGSAVSIRFTPNATPGAATGIIQTTIYYWSA